MELKLGYKQSEVGVIPEEWEVSTVGEEFDIKLGKMLDAEKNVGVPKPYIGNRAVQWDRIDTSELPTVPLSRSDMERFRLRKGDLLVCEGGEVGRAAIWEAPLEECYYQKALHRLRPTHGFDVKVMAAMLRQWADRGLLTNFVTQTSIAHLPREKFMEVPLLVPTPAEQRAIATALSDVDGLLGGLDRLIAKKRDLKQAAMQQLLTGQTRLPGFHGEWNAVRLGDVADPNRRWSFTGGPFGSNLKSSDYTEDGVRIIQLQNIGDGEFKDDCEIYTSAAKADELLSCNIYPGEIILSKMGDPVARACIIPPRHHRLLMCSDGIRLAVDPLRFDTYFVFSQINAPEFRNRAANAGTGSTRKRIGLSKLRSLDLNCGPLPEQTAIAEVLMAMDTELAALEQRREKTRALKQGMMQELLTGRTRLL